MEQFKVKTYTKQELTLLYFPDTQNVHTAVCHFMSWIYRCTPLMDELKAMGVQKRAKCFTAKEASAIVRHIGEP